MEPLFKPIKPEQVPLKKLDGYVRGYVDYRYWECPYGGVVVVEDDVTPSFESLSVHLQKGLCGRCCELMDIKSVDDTPILNRYVKCWKD